MNNLLPKYYIDWLSQMDIDDCVEYMDRDWNLDNLEELQKPVKIDRRTMPSYMQLASFMKTLLEVTGSSPLSIDKAEKCIVIGHCNGDPLFISPDDYSLWCYYLDGGDIEKVGASLQHFIETAIVDE